MGKALELEGQRFGRLIVKERTENTKWDDTRWLCECDCGNFVEITANNLKSGGTQSCGCFHKEDLVERVFKHGHSVNRIITKTYKTWDSMRQRCNNPKETGYKNWGGRGITICEQWNKFENFLQDMGEKPKGLTLDRINNDGNYEPDNCRWATRKEQIRNSRIVKLNPLKVQVIKKLLKESNLKQYEIAEIFGIVPGVISDIKKGKIWNDIFYIPEN